MKKIILTALVASLSACTWFGLKPDEEPQVGIPKPVPACVQQVEPKNPEIPCKVGDWFAPGHSSCSSTLAKCQAKG